MGGAAIITGALICALRKNLIRDYFKTHSFSSMILRGSSRKGSVEIPDQDLVNSSPATTQIRSNESHDVESGSVVIASTQSPLLNTSSASSVISSSQGGGVEAEGSTTAQFLEQEICENIYLACLAKVASMPINIRVSAEGMEQKAREWEAAKQEAERNVENRKQELEKATQEKNIADKEIRMMLDDRTFHGGGFVAKAYHDSKIKGLAEQLASARLETSKATLFAIQVEGTTKSEGAKAQLAEAIQKEKKALGELAEARTHAVEQNAAGIDIPVAEAVAEWWTPFFVRKCFKISLVDGRG